MFISLEKLLNKKKRLFQYNLDDAELPALFKVALEKIYPHALGFIKYKTLKTNVLYLQTKNPIWIAELESYKNKLKQELNKTREKPIENIKIVLE